VGDLAFAEVAELLSPFVISLTPVFAFSKKLF